MPDPLVAFLTAQLDERERIARAASRGPWTYGDIESVAGGALYDSEVMIASVLWDNEPVDPRIRPTRTVPVMDATGEHIALNDPTAALADVVSKRLILSMHAPSASGDECVPCVELDSDQYPIPWPCPTMRALATAFQHADGYQVEWAYDA